MKNAVSTGEVSKELPRLIAAAWLLVLASGVGVIYSSHQTRLLNNELVQLEREKHQLQVTWGQYLLEESTLASLQRVEFVASRSLGMAVPGPANVVTVQE